MNSLQQRIEAANAEGRMARIPFLTAGFPTPESFPRILRELDESGADIIEIGVPFSDPVADGPVVEDASRRALEQGVTLKGIMNTLAGLKPRLELWLKEPEKDAARLKDLGYEIDSVDIAKGVVRIRLQSHDRIKGLLEEVAPLDMRLKEPTLEEAFLRLSEAA